MESAFPDGRPGYWLQFLREALTMRSGAHFPQRSPVDSQVGSRIRLRRMILGMSQERLGGAIGVTFQQVQKYERGVSRVSAGRLHSLADALDVPVSYFFDEAVLVTGDGASERSKQAVGQDMPEAMSRETLELLRAYYGISDPEIRQRFLGLAKAVAKACAGK